VITGHYKSDGTDFYTVDVYVDGPAKMAKMQGKFYDGHVGQITYYGSNYELSNQHLIYTKTELDELNSPSSSLPIDNAGEKIDWAGDKTWQDKLGKFKDDYAKSITSDGRSWVVDWTATPEAIESDQRDMLLKIFRSFKMNRNAPKHNGMGLGMRACGGGVCYDQALVETYAIQGVGQPLGIKAYNLDGTTVNPQGGHGFVRVDLKGKPQKVLFDHAIDYSNPSKVLFPGVEVSVNNVNLISDPGWADYGTTEDQYARMSQGEALNPIPKDANRAVNGRSSSRLLSEVAKKESAKGPLNLATPQKVAAILAADRERFAQDVIDSAKKGESDPVQTALEQGKYKLLDLCNGALN
jgi:hypothetical protein